jgi:queuine/archaeosine tRNA-ribosyltransferase
VLFTAYDVFRSHDFWIDEVMRSGATLKEALVDLGFPKTNSLVTDTGVFEMEARKAGIAQALGIDVCIELTNAQIFEVYEMSGADFFVSPDEIILPLDTPEVVSKKIDGIKSNLSDLLEFIPASKIIGVIQGQRKEVVDNLLEFYREQEIEYFAVGGVIPLYHHDKELLQKHLRYVRESTGKEWLHVFGLPKISLLSYYLHDMHIDSVDTSTLTYLTAQRKYLVGLKPEPVRSANFEGCDCPGCRVLSRYSSTRSPDFFVNLYIHNIATAVRESLKKKKSNTGEENRENELRKVPTSQNQRTIEILKTRWMTAEEALQARRDDEYA